MTLGWTSWSGDLCSGGEKGLVLFTWKEGMEKELQDQSSPCGDMAHAERDIHGSSLKSF